MTEQQLNEEFKTLAYWMKGFRRAFYRSKLRQSNKAAEELMNQISSKSWEISCDIRAAYAEPIGRAVESRLERGA